MPPRISHRAETRLRPTISNPRRDTTIARPTPSAIATTSATEAAVMPPTPSSAATTSSWEPAPAASTTPSSTSKTNPTTTETPKATATASPPTAGGPPPRPRAIFGRPVSIPVTGISPIAVPDAFNMPCTTVMPRLSAPRPF